MYCKQINLRNIVKYSSLVKTVILSQCALGVSVMSGKLEVYSKNLVVKKTFQKCNPPDFTGESYPSKLTNKFFPHYGVILIFCCCFFVLFNAVKTEPKLTLHYMRKIFITVKILKIRPCKIAVIILKLEQYCFTTE